MEWRNWENTITHGLKWIRTVHRQPIPFLSVSWTGDNSQLNSVLVGPLEKSEIRLRGQHLWLSVSKFTLRGLRQVLQCRNSSSFLGPDGFSKDCGFRFHPLKGQEERERVWEGPLEHSIMDTPDGKQTGLAGRDSFRRLRHRRCLKTYIPRECGSVYISLGPFYHGKAVVWGNQTLQLTQRFKRIPIPSWEKSHLETYWRLNRNPEHLRNDFSPQGPNAKLNRQLHWSVTLK